MAINKGFRMLLIAPSRSNLRALLDEGQKVILYDPFKEVPNVKELISKYGASSLIYRELPERCNIIKHIISFFKSLFHDLEQIRPEVLVVSSLQYLPLVGIIKAYFRKHNKYKFILISTSHSSYTYTKALKKLSAAHFINWFSDYHFSLSISNVKDLIHVGVKNKKLMFQPNLISESLKIEAKELRNSYNKGASEAILLTCVSVIHRYKGQDILIKALDKIRLKKVGIKTILVGRIMAGEDKYFRYLKELISNLSMEDDILFLGELEHSKVLELLSKTDIFVYPSYSELMPRAIIEAMLMGTAVIASRVGGIPDIIEHKKTGILFQPGNVGQLAQYISFLIDNDGVRKMLGENAKKSITKICSAKEFLENLAYIINKDAGSIP